MVRLIGPDEGSRLVYRTSGNTLLRAVSASVAVFNVGTSVPADIQTLAGAAVPGSTLLTDAYSRIPLFKFPDGLIDAVDVVVDGGPVTTVYARADDRIDSVKVTADAAALAIAGLPATYAAKTRVSRFRVPPLTVSAPVVNPAPPTLAWTGPGGSNPIGGATFYWISSAGGTPVAAVTVVNSPLPIVDGTFHTVEGGAAGAIPTTMAIEFDFYGADMCFIFVPKAAALVAAQTMKLWVDDQPVTLSEPGGATVNGSSHYLRLTWGAAGIRRVKVEYNQWRLKQITALPTSTIVPVVAAQVRLAVVGDSWVEGSGAAPQLTYVDTIALRLGRLLGVGEVFPMGQGGTGYVSNGAGGNWGNFNDSRRLATLLASNPTDLVIFGSINDDSSFATVGAAATTLYTWCATNLPNCRLYVILPQPRDVTNTVSANHVANVAAVLAAATAAPNVAATLDTTAWLTGTGYTGGLVNDGNRDLFLGSDQTHPTPAGIEFFARRIAVWLSPFMVTP